MFLFQQAHVLLRRRDVEPSFFTLSSLDSGSGGGWVTLVAAKHTVYKHVFNTGRAVENEHLQSVLDQLQTPIDVLTQVPADKETGSSMADGADDSNEKGYTALTSKLTKGQLRWCDLLVSLVLGEFDTCLQKLAAEKNIVEQLHTQKSQYKELKLWQEYNTSLIELSNHAGQIVQEKSEAPAVCLRALARMSSDPEELALRMEQKAVERQEAWKEVQRTRAKLISIVSLPEAKHAKWSDAYEQTVRKAISASSRLQKEFEMNKAHRLFCVSGEFFSDENEAPWASTPCHRTGSRFEGALQWANAEAKNLYDFILAQDGRNLITRRLIEDTLDVIKNTSTTSEARAFAAMRSVCMLL